MGRKPGVPPPSSDAARRRMLAARQRDTAPEMALRSALHRLGLRYWVHRAPLPGIRRQADIVFPRQRLAIFVDGCFWHGCPLHGTEAKANAAFWQQKITRNRERDRETDRSFEGAGWLVVRVWEHEDPVRAAHRIERIVRKRAGPAD